MSHLLAHVEITPVLTPEQRARYAQLRGYPGGTAHELRERQHKHEH